MEENNTPIYLDYAATTPIDPQVAELMYKYIKTRKNFGNASSVNHVYGVMAKQAIEEARSKVAALINANAEEIIWTSGATESINLALKGVSNVYQKFGKHIITIKTEHKAVLETCQRLESEGFTVTYLQPNEQGLITVELLESAIRKDTILITFMHVNNETGVIQDIQKISECAHRHHILVHVDAAQSAGKLPLDMDQLSVDLLSISSHKIYGPKGIGALYINSRSDIVLNAQMDGGGQEKGLRSGTIPTHQVVGMGEAFSIAQKCLNDDYHHCIKLKDELLIQLMQIEGVEINSPLKNTVPNIINLSIKGIKNFVLINNIRGVAISSGSACSSSFGTSSYVLNAMRIADERIKSAVRLSWGRFTTIDEIKKSSELIKNTVAKLIGRKINT